jgi:anthranilate phosphoribosyltransferase
LLVPHEDFSHYVAILGRGPGRSRALTRDEARDAFAQLLAGDVDPHQVGAFLMLLRYRGEDADEIAGLVEAAQATLPAMPRIALDWPSYGAGRTRGVPWFLLAARALGQAGVRVLMHGSNAFGTSMSAADCLSMLGIDSVRDSDDVAEALDRIGFAYLPIERLAPEVSRLLALRRLFGLRSPVNTVARLLDPARAPAGISGVFHPRYIDVHIRVAEKLGRPRLLVLKGGGGEAERSPIKAGNAFLWDKDAGRSEIMFPPVHSAADQGGVDSPTDLLKVWRGDIAPKRAMATIHTTIAVALVACGRSTDSQAALSDAERIWSERKL